MENEVEDVLQELITSVIQSDKGRRAACTGFDEETRVADDLNNAIKCGEMFRVENNRSKVDVSNGKLKFQVKKSEGPFQQVWRTSVANFCDLNNCQFVQPILQKLCELPIGEDNRVVKGNERDREIDPMIEDSFLEFLNKPEIKYSIINQSLRGNDMDNRPHFLVYVEYDKNKNRKIPKIFYMGELVKKLSRFNFKVNPSRTVIALDNSGITIQRKGGDGGRPAGNDIQVKISFKKVIANTKPNYMDLRI